MMELRQGQIRVVRYADDFVVMHKNKKVIEDSKLIIAEWLKERGLELSEEKTKIVHSTEGFDFLGFNCKHYDNKTTGYEARNFANKQGFKILIKPSKKSIETHSNKIKEVLRQMKAATQEQVTWRLNPIIRGWANYYRTCVASETFQKLDYLRWCFATKTDGIIDQTLARYADTKIKRHVKVKAGKSYYDGDELYWGARLSKGYGDISLSKAKMLVKQNGKCGYCNASFKNGDLMEAHHKTFVKEGGKDSYKNLVLMHLHCHDQYHAEFMKRMKATGKFRGEA
ncbi:group II intron reverse transcriptase [Candidatus Marithrix sp. Canyon 246]|uniref:group II intron reverse transcriptase n=2 Tax=Candidatus Marithrix sp. Canyon 246 TaxID=1827136 RepID=UPI00084A1B1A|nr:group II intron maturase-specific domain-containing protein [Candidatus Marithrix sp. Canyon 246]